ncbi:MAG: hypothetical protein KJ621_08865 [Proteobacteria bacterium]|nr:hypothetical protein [Pseudomonadota bacterium]
MDYSLGEQLNNSQDHTDYLWKMNWEEPEVVTASVQVFRHKRSESSELPNIIYWQVLRDISQQQTENEIEYTDLQYNRPENIFSPDIIGLTRDLYKLNEFRSLDDNWNEYGSEAPNELALAAAREVLIVLQKVGLAPSRLAPSAEDGVGISFYKGNKYANIECFNDGEIWATISDPPKEAEIWQLSISPEDIRLSVEKIGSFLDA